MEIVLKEDVVSLTDFARNTKRHTEELADSGRPRILTQNGKATAVVLSPEAFQKMARDAQEYHLDPRLRKALENYASGDDGIPADEAFSKLQKRATKRRKARQ
jgi:PHD/YefM family antitoxin component YafN of YafNO toxin-antitoxin module